MVLDNERNNGLTLKMWGKLKTLQREERDEEWDYKKRRIEALRVGPGWTGSREHCQRLHETTA
jgi:hypothetical protein